MSYSFKMLLKTFFFCAFFFKLLGSPPAECCLFLRLSLVFLFAGHFATFFSLSATRTEKKKKVNFTLEKAVPITLIIHFFFSVIITKVW